MARTKEVILAKCGDCKHSYLMRSSEHNPIVSLCTRDNETRQVASTVHQCYRFKVSHEKKSIHEMIKSR